MKTHFFFLEAFVKTNTPSFSPIKMMRCAIVISGAMVAATSMAAPIPCSPADPPVVTNPASLTGHWQQGWSVMGVAAGGAPGWATSWYWSDGVIFSGPIQNDPARVQQFATALGSVAPSVLKGCYGTTWGTFKAYTNIPTLYTFNDPAASVKNHWITRAKLAPSSLACVPGERVQMRASHKNMLITGSVPDNDSATSATTGGAAVIYYKCV